MGVDLRPVTEPRGRARDAVPAASGRRLPPRHGPQDAALQLDRGGH